MNLPRLQAFVVQDRVAVLFLKNTVVASRQQMHIKQLGIHDAAAVIHSPVEMQNTGIDKNSIAFVQVYFLIGCKKSDFSFCQVGNFKCGMPVPGDAFFCIPVQLCANAHVRKAVRLYRHVFMIVFINMKNIVDQHWILSFLAVNP